jgi:hypothetical protein
MLRATEFEGLYRERVPVGWRREVWAGWSLPGSLISLCGRPSTLLSVATAPGGSARPMDHDHLWRVFGVE